MTKNHNKVIYCIKAEERSNKSKIAQTHESSTNKSPFSASEGSFSAVQSSEAKLNFIWINRFFTSKHFKSLKVKCWSNCVITTFIDTHWWWSSNCLTESQQSEAKCCGVMLHFHTVNEQICLFSVTKSSRMIQRIIQSCLQFLADI